MVWCGGVLVDGVVQCGGVLIDALVLVVVVVWCGVVWWFYSCRDGDDDVDALVFV